MVTQWFLDFLHGLGETLSSWMEGLIPSPPEFWLDATDAINSVFGTVPSALRYFIPLGPVVTAALWVTGLIVGLGLIRFGRRILSLFTGGGGMA